MPLYGVYEGELRTISMLNAITLIFGSLGTGSLSFAIGLIVDVAKEPDAVTHPSIVTMTCVICILVTIACYFIAAIAFKFRRSELTRIINESRPRA